MAKLLSLDNDCQSNFVVKMHNILVIIEMLTSLFRWMPELLDLVAELGDKLANKQKPRRPKPATG